MNAERKWKTDLLNSIFLKFNSGRVLLSLKTGMKYPSHVNQPLNHVQEAPMHSLMTEWSREVY